MVKKLILSGILLCGILAHAQKYQFGLQTGYGLYSMRMIENIAKQMRSEYISLGNVTPAFPPSVYFQPSFKLKLKHFNLGLIYSYYHTGNEFMTSNSRFATSQMNVQTNAHTPGISCEVPLISLPGCEILLDIKGGMTYNQIIISEKTEYHSDILFIPHPIFLDKKESNGYFEPGLKLHFITISHLKTGFSAGYFKEISRKNYAWDQKNLNLEVKEGYFRNDFWDGWRFGIDMVFTLGNKS